MGITEGSTSVKSGDGTIVSTGGLITGVTGGLANRVAVGVGLTGTVAGDTLRVVVVVVATMVGVKSGSTE